MNNRQKKAFDLHQKGYNCCQAVALAFADLFEQDAETVYKIAEGFGAGMGGRNGACGALSGAILLAGLKNSDGNLEGGSTKQETYKLSDAMYTAFAEKVGSVICRDIKGMDNQDVPLCSCDDCIGIAVEIAQNILDIKE